MLLQVVPVTLYGPKGYFNTHAILDTGSTCSLLLADVAEKLCLDGPLESALLNGIQKTSELLTRRVNVQVSPLNEFGTRFDVSGVSKSKNLFVKFIWQLQMRSSMKP